MVFKSVQGTCQRCMEHSWFNNREVEEVVKVIKDILPKKANQKGVRQIMQTDIGVVTMYRKQRHKLTQKFRRLNFDEIMVGTAEIFQGKEKPIMIVSTVRTDGQLGFVSEPRVSEITFLDENPSDFVAINLIMESFVILQRLNVVITRAKCLLVIIGDPFTLEKDANWLRVIKHCHENNSFIQSDKIYSQK